MDKELSLTVARALTEKLKVEVEVSGLHDNYFTVRRSHAEPTTTALLEEQVEAVLRMNGLGCFIESKTRGSKRLLELKVLGTEPKVKSYFAVKLEFKTSTVAEARVTSYNIAQVARERLLEARIIDASGWPVLIVRGEKSKVTALVYSQYSLEADVKSLECDPSLVEEGEQVHRSPRK